MSRGVSGLFIKQCKGYELEKEMPNTSEDFFNRSEVVYMEEGQEKTLHVLYIRYFEESMESFTPFGSDPVFKAGGREVAFKDLVALACLLKKTGLRDRKRVYINNKAEFESYFDKLDFGKLREVFNGVEEEKGFQIASPLDFFNHQQA
ncbi:hypothetical protein [Bacillus sp. UMB0728]|uniref:hypothetical protein n=1 Tax=Bacillus TaxID=1386 RepID=UPI000C78FA68|nr:hypothetical protein CYJ37_13180 [Bacillus sp. UMB0728]